MLDDELLDIGKGLFRLALSEVPFEQPFGDFVDGPIRIGTVKQTGAPFGLELHEINEHTFLTGRAGSGKTTINKRIMKQLPSHDVNFWAFDFKQDYRPLAKEMELYVLNWKNLKFNPLRPPPGCDPRIWMQAFINVFAQSYYLQVGTKELLLSPLDRLYADYGVYDGSGVYPSLHDLLYCLDMHRIEKGFGRESGFWESAKNRTRGTVLSLNEMFDCDKGFSLEHLLDKNVVLELDNLLYENQIFLVNIMLRYIFQYRMSQKHRGSLRHVIFFDEAKMVYDQTRDFIPGLGINEVTQFTTQIREFREGIVVSDQMPTMISESIKGSVYTMIGMSQSGGRNIQETAKAMNLCPDQLAFMTQLVSDKSLNLYEALVKINGRWTQPFAIEIIPSHFERSVSDYEIESRMRPLLEDLYPHVTPRTPYERILVAKKHEPEEKKPQTEQPPKEKEAVEGNILIKILTDIREEPFAEQKERITKLGLGSSSSTADKYFKQLVTSGFVKVHKIGLGRGKSTMVLYQITEQGMRFAKMNRFIIPGKGDFKHQFWQHTIRTFYRNMGYDAEIEKRLGNKNVDVGVQIENKKIAVEIELSPDHLIQNIEKDLEAGCDEVIIAVSSKKTAVTYKKKITEHDKKLLTKVEMRVLTEFLD